MAPVLYRVGIEVDDGPIHRCRRGRLDAMGRDRQETTVEASGAVLAELREAALAHQLPIFWHAEATNLTTHRLQAVLIDHILQH